MIRRYIELTATEQNSSPDSIGTTPTHHMQRNYHIQRNPSTGRHPPVSRGQRALHFVRSTPSRRALTFPTSLSYD